MYIKDLQKRLHRLKRRMDPEIIEIEKRLERQKGIVQGFAIGSVIAGITALFLSPDSGKNNRRKAKEELDKTKEILEVNFVEGKRKLSQIYGETKEAISDKKNMMAEKLNYDDGINVLEEDFFEQETFEEVEDEY